MSTTNRSQGFFNKKIKEIRRLKIQNRKVSIHGKTEKSPPIFSLSNTLDEFYFLEKLKIYCQYLSRNHIVTKDEIIYSEKSIKLLNPILKELEINDFDNPAVQIFLEIKKLYMILDKGDIIKIAEEKIILAKIYRLLKSKLLINDERIEVYSYVSNFLIKRYNQGVNDYLPNIILTYNRIFELRYTAAKNHKFVINSNILKNMVVLGLRYSNPTFWQKLETPNLKPKSSFGFASAEEWVEKLITFYQHNLPNRDKKTFVGFCLGKLNFQNRKFKKAFENLKPLYGTKGLYIKYEIKLLYLQCLWEIGVDEIEDEIFIKDIINSLRKALDEDKKKKTKIAYQRAYYENFYHMINSMNKLKDIYDRKFSTNSIGFEKESNKLKNQIDNCSYSHKEWFEEHYLKIIKETPN